MLDPEQKLGFVDLETLPKEDCDHTENEDRLKQARANIPPLSSILNLNDMEVSPQGVLSILAGLIPPERKSRGVSCPQRPGLSTVVRPKMAGVENLHTSNTFPDFLTFASAHRNNLGAFNFYWFRPRVYVEDSSILAFSDLGI